MFNHERCSCSLTGSTVYPGASFGVSLKLLYPETDLLAESFCCRSNNRLPGADSCMQDTFARATHSAYAAARPSARATIGYLVYNADSCWKIPYVGWCITAWDKLTGDCEDKFSNSHYYKGAKRGVNARLERFRLLRYLIPWVGCKRPCSKEPCIDSQEGEQRKIHIEC